MCPGTRWLSLGVLGDDLASSGVSWFLRTARAMGIEWEDYSGFHAGLEKNAGGVPVVQEMPGRTELRRGCCHRMGRAPHQGPQGHRRWWEP